MSLKGNTTYSGAPNLQPIISAIAKVGKSFGPRNDVSRFQGVANSVKNYTPASGAPSQPSRGTVTTPYGGSTRYEAFHPGVDIDFGGINAPVKSYTPGVVARIEKGHKQGEKNYGNYIIVVDPQGNQLRYSHLNQSYVSVGQPVARGMDLAGEGNTGMTYSPSGKGTGAHLDLRIKDMYNKYVDPTKFING